MPPGRRLRNWTDTSSAGDPPPRELPLLPGDALILLQQTIGRLPRWRVETIDTETHTLRATRQTRLWRFIDDITVRVEGVSDSPPRSRVHVRSQSRVGLWDLGENRRNILELFAALERGAAS
jgi:uncharacterized protein (DUF1499 family)